MSAPVLILKPLTIIKPWAGSKLKRVLTKNVPKNTGETWEFAKECLIYNNDILQKYYKEPKNITLKSIFEKYGNLWYGTDEIKILIKFIDTQDFLSLQVHPNDAEAQMYENQETGKSEAWFFIDVDSDSEVINGLNKVTTTHGNDNSRVLIEPKTTYNSQVEFIKNNFSKISVYSNSTMMIPAGLVHAIGPGILLYEIQQYSDITYRLYDWDRTDRELHVNKGLNVLKEGVSSINTLLDNPIINNQYFETNLYNINKTYRLETKDKYNVMSLIQGSDIKIIDQDTTYILKLGQTACLPINSKYVIEGSGRILVSESKI